MGNGGSGEWSIILCWLSPAGGGYGSYNIIRSWEYVRVCHFLLVVRNVINNRIGGGERKDCA